MHVPAASLDQVVASSDGRMVSIDAELSHVARDLEAIPLPSREGTTAKLRLRWSEATGVFIVYQEVTRDVDGSPLMKQLVTTWDPAVAGGVDSGLVERCKRVTSPSYDLAAEIDRIDREDKAGQEHEMNERMGEQAGLLHHAMIKDKGLKPRIFVPRGV